MTTINRLRIASITVLASTISILPIFVNANEVEIGFANRTMNGPYFNALTHHIEMAGEENGYKVYSTDARGDINKQVSDVEDLLSKGIKYLILDPQDPLAGEKMTRIANSKGVQVITVDSHISETAPVVTRVQPADEKNNVMIGEMAAKQFGDQEVKLALISGNQGNLGGKIRRDNFINGVISQQLRDHNETRMQIVGQLWGNWDQIGGLKAMEDLLVSQPDLNAVYAENDDMALGAIRAIRASGKSFEEVRVYSYDGSKKGYQAIIDGQLQATAMNSPTELSKKVIEVINALEKGETEFQNYSRTKAVLVNKENVKQYYDENAMF
ncbi:ABC transporter substrate-binding protein [Vibrio sinensis]|uniref:Autoinducer 2-binding periplasmic protein LuxP n=1 Tax=Vibrio sinensis TaxID=2302434 RepID=A0A3A6QVF7_9VIBR|nr:substrate-binding domain-containing protein [Vibrio sinensis]RJX72884.1 ABC transporter substrate-binding protein [Vibrio sinensis]